MPKTAAAKPALGWGKKLLFSLTTCLVLLGTVEVGWRLAFGWNRSWLDSHRWHPALGWSLREGWASREAWTGGFSRINPQGIRDDRPVGPREPGERRLLVLGDSVTFGAMVRTDETFTHHLEQALPASDVHWRVLNGGVTGYDSSQEADWLEYYGWRLEPDALAVAFCRNDLYPSVRSQFKGQQPAGAVGRWLTEHSILAYKLQHGIWYLEARLGLASATVKEAPANTNADQPRPGFPFVEAAYRRIAARAREKLVPVVLFIYPTLGYLEGREPDDLTEKLQALGRELGWTVIDLAPAFAANAPSLYLPGDPLHPNGAGYHAAAVYAARELAERRLVP